MTHLSPVGDAMRPRATARTVLSLLAILSMLLSTMVLVRPSPALAVFAPPPHTIFAMTELCPDTAVTTQFDWQGNDTVVFGSIHSNAGMNISGNDNDATSTATFDDATCNLSLSGDDNEFETVPPPSTTTPVHAGSSSDPAYPAPTCTFTFNGNKDLSDEVVAGVLPTGTYCVFGGKLDLSAQGVSGTVTFYSNNMIVLGGSDLNLQPYADGMLLHSTLASVDAITVSGSDSTILGITYAPNGEAEFPGQDLTVGCVAANTVKIHGSDHTYVGCAPGAPEPGAITILKQDPAQQPLGGATFSITPDPIGDGDALSITDDDANDESEVDGTIHISGVEPGDYTVCETAAPAGYIREATCRTMTVASGQTATFGPFTNGLGQISWTKVDEQSNEQVCCAQFSLVGTDGPAIGFSLTLVDNDSNDADATNGALLVAGLKLGTYRITETTPPAGYDLPATTFQDVVLSGASASAAFAFEDPPQADASITKSAVLTPVVAGQQASFAIVVHAGGTGDSEEVVLTDVNDTGHGWTVTGDDAGACADTTIADGETLSCNFGTVPNGEDRSVTITMTSDPGDCANGIANTATVTSSNDHDTSNNEASASVTILCPNPGVVKAALVDPIVAGDDAAFTVTVTAGGTGAATNVVLSDLNDTGHDWTVTGTDAGACADTTIPDGESLSCTWPSIPNGESRTVTVTMKSDADDCELGIANTASITANADVDTSNNVSSASIEVLCPDPSVVKTAFLDPITAGDPATFTVVVSAGGTGNSEGVVLSDLNETAHPWTVSGADAAACAALSVGVGETLSCDFGTIPNGGTRTISITMTSDAEDCAEGIANTAKIVAAADVDESNNESTASIEVLCPDLEIEKTTTTPVVSAGNTASYTVEISNESLDAEARDVTITDDLPDGLTWVEDSEDCEIDGDGDLLCEDLTIAAGGHFSVTVTGTTDSGDCPSIENSAEFTSSNGGSGSSDSDQRGATVITVNCPDVSLDKEPVATPISAEERAEFKLKVTNLGPGTATNVTVVDRAPLGTTTWEVLDPDGFACNSVIGGGLQAITCTIAELAPGEANARTIVIGYWTTADDCGSLLNAARSSAANEPAQNRENNGDSAMIVVECPGLNVLKETEEEDGAIDAGQVAAFTITVWNAGPGDAFDVTLDDDLPPGFAWDFDVLEDPNEDVACGLASSAVQGAGGSPMSLHCDLFTLEPNETVVIRVFAPTDRTDCGPHENTAFVDASNLREMLELLGLEQPIGDVLDSTATLTVHCPIIRLEKANNTGGAAILPGTPVTYTLTLTVDDVTPSVTDSKANAVIVRDVMPIGLENPTDISDGGTFNLGTRTITWNLGDLAQGEYTLTYKAVLAEDVENGDELVNAAAATSPNSQCPNLATLGPECDDTSIVIPRIPTLVIDKVANVEEITISGPASAPVATPSVITWTLTYTLTNGPVTNAVITDEVPDGVVYVAGSASNGGVFDDASDTLTWTFPTLSASGSVTFQTTVDAATISLVAPTVNVTVIDSNETTPDEGQDSVRAARGGTLGGTPTPRPSLPNTAVGTGIGGEPVTVPVELLAMFFLGSLGALAYANVRARRER